MTVRAKHGWPRRWNATVQRYEVEVEPGLWVSRQRAWQLVRQERGLCGKCGGPRNEGVLCDGCLTHANVTRQQLHGYKPWHPGGRGRPPKHTKRKESTK